MPLDAKRQRCAHPQNMRTTLLGSCCVNTFYHSNEWTTARLGSLPFNPLEESFSSLALNVKCRLDLHALVCMKRPERGLQSFGCAVRPVIALRLLAFRPHTLNSSPALCLGSFYHVCSHTDRITILPTFIPLAQRSHLLSSVDADPNAIRYWGALRLKNPGARTVHIIYFPYLERTGR